MGFRIHCANGRLTRNQALCLNLAKKSHNIAVVGAGLAGLSVTYHLLKLCSESGVKVRLSIYDATGIGGGASKAAAGLLHELSPRGKVGWKGQEAFKETFTLVKIVERSAAQVSAVPLIFEKGLIFQASRKNQFKNFIEDESGSTLITKGEALGLVKGLMIENPDDLYGLNIPHGYVINTQEYMKQLWILCQDMASTSDVIEDLKFSIKSLNSLKSLEESEKEFTAVISAIGASSGNIQEFKNKLPLQFYQGCTVNLVPMDHKNPNTLYTENSPSILGNVYLASTSPRSLRVGATRRLVKLQDLESLPDFKEEDSVYLLENIRKIWEPSMNWRIGNVISGIRAVPPKTSLGALPLLGNLRDIYWVFTGLGSRGILYHAILGKWLAQAVLNKNENLIPKELTRWKCQS